jgi:exosome complex component RRP40
MVPFFDPKSCCNATCNHRRYAGSFAEEYKVDIKSPSPALLPVLAFEGATKRNRPFLNPGDIVFCRVTAASMYMDPELSCMDSQGRSDGLGLVSGGCMLETTTGHCRRLLQKQPPLELQLIRDAVACELVVGANGRVWVKSNDPRKTAAIANILRTCAVNSGDEDVKRIVERCLGNLNIVSN